MGIEYANRKNPPRQGVPKAGPVKITHAGGTVEVRAAIPAGRAINRRGKPLKGKRGRYRRRKKKG